MRHPKILSPAGDKNSFLAAIAGGADAVYCGLKMFSARMEAENFSVEELSRLSKLAHAHHVELYITFNTTIKDNELERVFKILGKLCSHVDIDALIIQDPAVIPLARAAGFTKQFHLSTLGNCTSGLGLETAEQFGFNKVVLPREFNIDEIKRMADQAPSDVDLEMFIHGALCYCVSGRCYWSSWFGGKSALRGRCVQPCRRIYSQKGVKKQHFSCLDYSADILVKVLKQIDKVTTWKIEGRKKSPHYVYYTTKAYKLLRDDPGQKKQAMTYLDYAMGRISTHYNLLTQRQISPLDHSSETGSGLFAGRIKNPAEPYFVTREALFPMDLLRIGSEDDIFHDIQKVTRAVPKKGNFYLSKKGRKKIKKGTPVYLIDRRGQELISAINELEKQLSDFEKPRIMPVKKAFGTNGARPFKKKTSRIIEMIVSRGKQPRANHFVQAGTWISGQGYSVPVSPKNWLWLDPLIFPKEEQLCINAVSKALKKGAKNFVLNSLWQLSFFKNPKKLNLWAGPFCNITNSVTADVLLDQGFSGAIVSPELDQKNFLSLPSNTQLALGVVVYGNWPLGISRIISDDLALNKPFASPMGETAWVSKRNASYYIYPNWPLDLKTKKNELVSAGYQLLVEMIEPVPKSISMKDRQGLWNWNLNLL